MGLDPIVVIKRRPKVKVKKIKKPVTKSNMPSKRQIAIAKKKRNKEAAKLRKEVEPIVLNILPKNIPYVVGIDKDVVLHLKAMYPGRITRMRKAVTAILHKKTKDKEYRNALVESEYRYGLSGKRYKRTDSDKESHCENWKVLSITDLAPNRHQKGIE